MIKTYTFLSMTALIFLGCGTHSTVTKYENKEALGESLFFDNNLSLTRNTSCATCHDPKHAFIDARHTLKGANHVVNGALSVGDDGLSLGGRNSPTVAYAKFSPEFNRETLKGGQFHDGRASTLVDQAMGPPLDAAEMMMPDKASVVGRIKENYSYLEGFKKFFGKKIFENNSKAYQAMAIAIAAFEQTELFSPFDSKYDRYLQGEYNLSTQEEQGMDIFFSEERSNCRKCHTMAERDPVVRDTFTNYKYINIGTPKNSMALEARYANDQAERNATDHGVLSQNTISDTAHDGKVKVPTLRNIAITGPYMSNGVFANLRTVLAFYDHRGGDKRRMNNPETDLPWRLANVEETINHKALKMPALSDEDMDALEVFLGLLTDKRYEYLLKK